MRWLLRVVEVVRVVMMIKVVMVIKVVRMAEVITVVGSKRSLKSKVPRFDPLIPRFGLWVPRV